MLVVDFPRGIAAHYGIAPSTQKFLTMTSSTTNKNVRQPDVLKFDATVAAPDLAQAEDIGSRTLRRGLHLLDAVLKGGRDGLRVVDLCRATGLERATVYRLLATLVESGYVAAHGRFRYVAGPRLAEHAKSAVPSDFAARLQPVLARVSAACGDAAFAIVREGPASHCIALRAKWEHTRCKSWSYRSAPASPSGLALQDWPC